MNQTDDDLPAYEYWNCPNCDCLNLDSRDLTPFPICEQCLAMFEWIDVSSIDPNDLDE